MPNTTPSIAQLKHALSIAEEIESLKDKLNAIMSGGSSSSPVVKSASEAPAPGRPAKVGKTGKRFVSAESRAKMAAAQHARWARNNPSASSAAAAPKAAKGKRKGGLSPEGRARIIAALKARHAANRRNRA